MCLLKVSFYLLASIVPHAKLCPSDANLLVPFQVHSSRVKTKFVRRPKLTLKPRR
jgi:hypothetical protein